MAHPLQVADKLALVSWCPPQSPLPRQHGHADSMAPGMRDQCAQTEVGRSCVAGPRPRSHTAPTAATRQVQSPPPPGSREGTAWKFLEVRVGRDFWKD
jgi:hypothetical protein